MTRSLITALAVLAFNGPAAVANKTVPCFAGFANLSDDPAAREKLIVSTYGDLFEELGAKVPKETLEAMAETDSPFEVPGKDPQFDSLQKWLREFRETLERNGWNTPDLRERLTTELRARAGGVREAKTKRDSAIVRCVFIIDYLQSAPD